MSRLSNTIEAILYLKAQPLKIAQIAELAKCDRDTAEEGLIELMGDYAHRDGAIEIAETEDGYALQLREVYKPLVDDIVPLDIGLGALRTLAAIALRGPIAQSELVDLRGSGVYQHVPDLVEQGFVKKRRQSDGRSSWLQITEKFYQHFEIDKLPQISNLRLPKPISKADDEANEDRSTPTAEPRTEAETSIATDSEPSETMALTEESFEDSVLEGTSEAAPLELEPQESALSASSENSERLGDRALDEIAEDLARSTHQMEPNEDFIEEAAAD